MSEIKTDVALVNLPAVKVELEKAFLNDEYIDNLIKEIRQKASTEVGDIKTAKGRAVYVSMAAKVRSAKVMIDDAGKALVAEMKSRPALVDASRRKVREALDALAIEIRKPVTDWEEEQAQIKADREAKEERLRQEAEAARKAEQDAKDKEVAHAMALLENIIFDRDLADRLAEQERLRIENEERIRREAAAQAIKDEQARHQAELDAVARRESEAKEAQQKAEREAQEAAEQAEKDKQAALAKAERDKQEAIDKANRDAKFKEDARLYAEKCRADEAAARAANVEHKRKINRSIIAALIKDGVPEEFAQKCVVAIASGRVPQTVISY